MKRGLMILCLFGSVAWAEAPPPLSAPSPQEIRTFERAARKGDPQALYRLGLAAEINNNLGLALKWYQQAAAKGNGQAAIALGTLHYTGRGVPADIPEALRWYRRGAESGYPPAQHAYAAALAGAPGDLRNLPLAVTWWEKAARNGHTTAQHNLCLALRDGRGVLQDEESALAWCVIAGSIAEDDVIEMRRRLNQGQVERGYVKAADLKKEILSKAAPQSK